MATPIEQRNWGIEVPLAEEEAAETPSRRLLEEAAAVIPGGVNTAKRRVLPQICLRSGSGGHVEDLEGRRLIDYHAAYGAVFLGHAFPAVTQGVARAIEGGSLFGLGITEAEVALARKITSHVPSAEQVLLCGSGSEATLHAIRLARAATGRSKIVKFQGCYHGFHDYVARNYLSLPAKVGRRDPFSAGLLKPAVDHTLVCRFNDPAEVETAFDRHDIAAVIVEPIAHNAASILPKPGFLERLRSLCSREGAVLIFDEVITGFRHDLGGYQAICQVTPDLTTMAKALGNGIPVAALGGKRELMERFNTADRGDVWFAGTYNGNAAGVAAALASIVTLESQDVHNHVFRLGDRMRRGLREITDRAGIPATVSGYGSVFVLCFMEGPIESYEDVLRNDVELFVTYRRELLRRGVLEIPENLGRSHIMYSHTDADVDHTLEAAEAALTNALDLRVR
jgi:glutamate-1-semialdehyde 2,1-aminomutase